MPISFKKIYIYQQYLKRRANFQAGNENHVWSVYSSDDFNQTEKQQKEARRSMLEEGITPYI